MLAVLVALASLLLALYLDLRGAELATVLVAALGLATVLARR